jgi:hypothetical protein
LAFSLIHGHERFSFLKCDTWDYVLCSWRGLKIRTSFLLRWWNLFVGFESDSLIYSFKDHLCKRQYLSSTNQDNIRISHHARKARQIWRKCSWYRNLLFQKSQQSRHFEIRELMHTIQHGVSLTLPPTPSSNTISFKITICCSRTMFSLWSLIPALERHVVHWV